MAIALLFLVITRRVTAIAGLLWRKTRPAGLIAIYAAAPAERVVFVAVLNACITKRKACIAWLFCPEMAQAEAECRFVKTNRVQANPLRWRGTWSATIEQDGEGWVGKSVK